MSVPVSKHAVGLVGRTISCGVHLTHPASWGRVSRDKRQKN